MLLLLLRLLRLLLLLLQSTLARAAVHRPHMVWYSKIAWQVRHEKQSTLAVQQDPISTRTAAAATAPRKQALQPPQKPPQRLDTTYIQQVPGRTSSCLLHPQTLTPSARQGKQAHDTV
jgi:hypothetical protein